MQDQSAQPPANRPSACRRRCQRLSRVVPLVVRGELEGRRAFWEDTFTFNVSALGALINLAAEVRIGQKLVLLNPQTWLEEDARITRLGAREGSKTQVGVDFIRPARDFWSASVEPADSPGNYSRAQDA